MVSNKLEMSFSASCLDPLLGNKIFIILKDRMSRKKLTHPVVANRFFIWSQINDLCKDFKSHLLVSVFCSNPEAKQVFAFTIVDTQALRKCFHKASCPFRGPLGNLSFGYQPSSTDSLCLQSYLSGGEGSWVFNPSWGGCSRLLFGKLCSLLRPLGSSEDSGILLQPKESKTIKEIHPTSTSVIFLGWLLLDWKFWKKKFTSHFESFIGFWMYFWSQVFVYKGWGCMECWVAFPLLSHQFRFPCHRISLPPPFPKEPMNAFHDRRPCHVLTWVKKAVVNHWFTESSYRIVGDRDLVTTYWDAAAAGQGPDCGFSFYSSTSKR